MWEFALGSVLTLLGVFFGAAITTASKKKD